MEINPSDVVVDQPTESQPQGQEIDPSQVVPDQEPSMADQAIEASKDALQAGKAAGVGVISAMPGSHIIREYANEYLPDVIKENIPGVLGAVAGPMGYGAGKALMMPEEEVKQSEAEHPIASAVGKMAGSVAPFMATEGLLSASPIGEAVEALSGWKKIAAENVFMPALTSGLVTAADEVSKGLAGQGDENAPIASALTNIAGNAGFAGAAGLAVPLIAKALPMQTAKKAYHFMKDFANELKLLAENPDPVKEMANEINLAYGMTKAGSDQTFFSGDEGVSLKNQVIDKLAVDADPEKLQELKVKLNDTISSLPKELSRDKHLMDFTNKLKRALKIEPVNEPTSFSSSNFSEPSNDINESNLPVVMENNNIPDVVSRLPVKSSYAPDELPESIHPERQVGIDQNGINGENARLFKAIDEYKKVIQSYSKYKYGNIANIEAGLPRNQAYEARKISALLKDSLEDTDVWGKLGDFQSKTNSAFKDWHDSIKPFKRQFMFENSNGELEAKLTSVEQHLKNLGEYRGQQKTGSLSTFIDATDKYHNVINDLYNELNIHRPAHLNNDIYEAYFDTIPMSIARRSVNKTTDGMKAALDYTLTSPEKIGKAAATTIGGALGATIGGIAGPGGATAGGYAGARGAQYFGDLATKLVGKPVSSKISSALIKMLADNNPQASGAALKYAINAQKGNSTIQSTIKNLFTASNKAAYDYYLSDSVRNKIKKHIENAHEVNFDPGQVIPDKVQGMAEGGQVEDQFKSTPLRDSPTEEPSDLYNAYPDHALAIDQSRARVTSYLKSMQPVQDQPAALFDHSKDISDKEKAYDKIVEMSAHPLKIMNDVKEGSVTPEDMQHLKSMYPEIHNYVSSELTKHLMEMKMKDERPSYKTRQGLSVFLGAPLDSTFTPQSIMAAQSVFANQKAQQPQQKSRKPPEKNKLDKAANSYRTTDQATVARQLQ